jgi:hypothetical protein
MTEDYKRGFEDGVAAPRHGKTRWSCEPTIGPSEYLHGWKDGFVRVRGNKEKAFGPPPPHPHPIEPAGNTDPPIETAKPLPPVAPNKLLKSGLFMALAALGLVACALLVRFLVGRN